jgi:hypothetical protein
VSDHGNNHYDREGLPSPTNQTEPERSGSANFSAVAVAVDNADLDEFSDFRIDSDVGADAIERGAEW